MDASWVIAGSWLAGSCKGCEYTQLPMDDLMISTYNSVCIIRWDDILTSTFNLYFGMRESTNKFHAVIFNTILKYISRGQ